MLSTTNTTRPIADTLKHVKYKNKKKKDLKRLEKDLKGLEKDLKGLT